jgi:hypothetical protein
MQIRSTYLNAAVTSFNKAKALSSKTPSPGPGTC